MSVSKMEDIHSNDDMPEGPWNGLPESAIASVFSYLKLKDRVNASSVCKNWSKGFESPNLWKSVDIWLTGETEKEEQIDMDSDRIGTYDDFVYYEENIAEIMEKRKKELRKLRKKLKAMEKEELRGKEGTEDQKENIGVEDVEGHDGKKGKKRKGGTKKQEINDDVNEQKEKANAKEKKGISKKGNENWKKQNVNDDKKLVEGSEQQKEKDEKEEENYGTNNAEKGDETIKPVLSFSNEKALQFAKKYGGYVKSLRLMCDPMFKEWSGDLREKISQFLKILLESSCELTELMVFFTYTDDEWDEAAKKDLINDFSEFFVCQHRMETLIFCNGLFGEEVLLLEAAVNGSGSTIRNLHCMFYNNDYSKTGYQQTYCTVLSKMPNLQFLSLRLHSLNNQVVATLNNCKSLKTVYLYDLDTNQDVIWRPVGPAFYVDWKEPLKIQPEKTSGGDFWLKCPELPPFIPLKVLFYVNVQVNFQDDEVEIITVLKFLRRNYHKDLVSFSMIRDEDFFENPHIERAITKLLVACTELQELQLRLNVSLDLLEEIYSLQFQNKIDLLFFWFRCLDQSCNSTKLEKLRHLFKQYENLPSGRNWILEIYEVHYK